MTRPPKTPAAVPATLTQQKVDFTAEGAPPPGKVSTVAPVTPDEPSPTANRKPVPARKKTPSKRPPAAKRP